MSWLSQYFLNPAFVLPGAALASVPIIIHLLSRLRYKRVRFAAMEFLLQSDELNRRRVIIEQLILLLLRVLAVLLIVLLIARLILDPSRMMLLRGVRTHHVLIIDDSVSMRESADGKTRFEQAITTLERMLTQAGRSGATLQTTVLTTSAADRPLVTDRELNNSLIQELIPRLKNLRCSYRTVPPTEALQAAYNVLSGDGGVTPQVHLITDFRATDWHGQPDVAKALAALETIDARVNLIQVADRKPPNIALTRMSAATLATAVGMPWRLDLTFHNFSDQKVSGLRATVTVDGSALPVKALIPDIEANEDAQLAHDIVFGTPGQHSVEVRLETDALPEDNARYLVADVAEYRSILVIDDDPRREDSGYLAAALTSDQVAVEVRESDALLTEILDHYDFIYLLNVREFPADARILLTEYVRSGGGIAWFPGEQANTTWYNTELRSEQSPLFPVRLNAVRSIPAPADNSDKPEFQIPVFEPHPIFAFYNDTPFADDIHISKWFGIEEESPDTKAPIQERRILARLANGQPIVFEHRVGQGKVLTFLFGAGKRWSNWPVMPAAPGYVVTNLLMHQYLQRPADNVETREIGGPLRFEWPVTRFTETVEVFLPASEEDAANSFLRLKATPVTESQDTDTQSASGELLEITLNQADRPGVYRLKRFRPDGQTSEKWIALSVSSAESDLTLADAAQVEGISRSGHIRVVSAESASELAAEDAGRELRRLLLLAVLAVLAAEQLMALRLSYHPEVSP